MHRCLVGVACAAALAVAAVPAAPAGPPIELPALTRIASRLSGLQSRGQVRVVPLTGAAMDARVMALVARDYPPDQQAYDETLYRALGLLGAGESLHAALAAEQRGVLGLYDPAQRTVYVRLGPTERPALLHELVHALQDQAFGLGRLADLRRGNRDAANAAAAAVEGDAAFATQVLRGRSLALAPARASASHGGPKIAVFLGLEHQFPYTTGLRFVASLHNLGGNPAVFGALRRFPETTEQIFHIDAFLAREQALTVVLPPVAAGFALSRSDSFGELDVRALLAVFRVPRLDHAGDGWGGGRTALYLDGTGRRAPVVALDWDTPLDAEQWDEAVLTYVNEAFDADTPGFPALTPCAAEACWSVAGRSIAFARSGVRTALAFGPDLPSAAALAKQIVG